MSYVWFWPIGIGVVGGGAFLLVLGHVTGWLACLRRLRIDTDYRARMVHASNGADFVFEPTHRHRKGGLYREIMRGVREHDLEPVVVYRGEDGTIWTRPVAEFDDGRFTRLGG